MIFGPDVPRTMVERKYDTKHAVTVTGERDGVHVYQPACANSF